MVRPTVAIAFFSLPYFFKSKLVVAHYIAVHVLFTSTSLTVVPSDLRYSFIHASVTSPFKVVVAAFRFVFLISPIFVITNALSVSVIHHTHLCTVMVHDYLVDYHVDLVYHEHPPVDIVIVADYHQKYLRVYHQKDLVAADKDLNLHHIVMDSFQHRYRHCHIVLPQTWPRSLGLLPKHCHFQVAHLPISSSSNTVE